MTLVVGAGGISAKVIADSTSPEGVRIVTMQLRYPRFIHGEFMTHRLFSRNAASSRAIPVAKMVEQVICDPAMPVHWGLNKPGMQADGELSDVRVAEDLWQSASEYAADSAIRMNRLQLHKQVTNRILEPFQFMQTLVTATEWDNFFALRIHKDAQPEIQELAKCMKEAMDLSISIQRLCGSWHLPYITLREFTSMGLETAIKCSAARCARVSYLKHDNTTPSVEEDLRLFNMLAVRPFDDGKGHILGSDDPVHLSPLEHQAYAIKEFDIQTDSEGNREWAKGVTHVDRNQQMWSGNFRGWVQFRQLLV